MEREAIVLREAADRYLLTQQIQALRLGEELCAFGGCVRWQSEGHCVRETVGAIQVHRLQASWIGEACSHLGAGKRLDPAEFKGNRQVGVLLELRHRGIDGPLSRALIYRHLCDVSSEDWLHNFDVFYQQDDEEDAID